MIALGFVLTFLMIPVTAVAAYRHAFARGHEHGRVLERRDAAMNRLAGKAQWVFRDDGAVHLYAMAPDGMEYTRRWENRTGTRNKRDYDENWYEVESATSVNDLMQKELTDRVNIWIALKATKARES